CGLRRGDQVLERANEKLEFPVKWGVDLQSEHERYLTEKYAKKPVIVMNYPKDIKAFYMRLNDDGRTVAAMDVVGAGDRRDQRREPARGASRGLGPEHDRARYRQGALRLVSRAPPLRHSAPRRLRPRLRAHPCLRHRPRQRPRRHPLPKDARQRAVLTR